MTTRGECNRLGLWVAERIDVGAVEARVVEHGRCLFGRGDSILATNRLWKSHVAEICHPVIPRRTEPKPFSRTGDHLRSMVSIFSVPSVGVRCGDVGPQSYDQRAASGSLRALTGPARPSQATRRSFPTQPKTSRRSSAYVVRSTGSAVDGAPRYRSALQGRERRARLTV